MRHGNTSRLFVPIAVAGVFAVSLAAQGQGTTATPPARQGGQGRVGGTAIPGST